MRRRHHRGYRAAELAVLRGPTTVSVVIPAHDEEGTVGDIVRTIRRDLVEAAKPLLARCFPELAVVEQPLAGECAVTRRALDAIALADGYAVEVAMLIDVAARFSVDAIAQVDLDRRTHRNRPLAALTLQAREVVDAVLDAHACSTSPSPEPEGGPTFCGIHDRERSEQPSKSRARSVRCRTLAMRSAVAVRRRSSRGC